MKLIEAFARAVIAQSSYGEEDFVYLCNRVLALVGEGGDGADNVPSENLIDLKDALVALAAANGKAGETADERECLGAALMDFITPPPSAVNRRFYEQYADDPAGAVAAFYELSKRNDYVKTKAVAKNIYYTVPTGYGDLEITVNLSKPEKDPKAIAAAKKAAPSGYPACQLCMENEGYQGRIGYPARANHRIIRMDLDGAPWGFQYSPYAYFNEHSIVLDTRHVPMVISRRTFARLLAITDFLPGYFAGSNADLPIVGGSILTHDHYQTGRHTFAMEKAPVEKSFTFAGFEDIRAGIVKWPMSVIRLNGGDKARLTDLAEKILQAWRGYSDESADVIAESGGEPHHTVTPIARQKDGGYELDLVLRDNHTSAEFPDGVYHPHPDVQHIKKENIGLIEVMGLAILPPRLKDEMREVEKFLLGRPCGVEGYHLGWAGRLKAEHPAVSSEAEAQNIVRQSVGRIFARVLEDAGVYKRTSEGMAAFVRFVESVGIL
ncbi:UDP-glucose--hexose-1-phosphate uridylyltransferase [Neisseria chenwenguii]|uniref:Galactose-1-phosphate uridylyltransferase n=1 Tax=Neisseria chenwenguii TaxID=1853278 RepID=A0A220RZZ6_9NEIS|nr:UDP-glucose--hexose-1-phosphate uridylyltransferase [Neisseria chenwenguii]ASK26799.1 UDP-glucose--hexose-1-phosphate uridylyltransferase [Neisseria chenwenguii]ROV56776.1 UDP-glucose--hexose-1-phosphate uridylyltransferase [Neisseria chenwenguii]